MQMLFSVILWSIIFTSCTERPNKQSEGIEAYEFSQVTSNVSMEGAVIGKDTSWVRVYYYQGATLFRFGNLFITESDDHKSQEMRYQFFVLKNGQPNGYLFDNHQTPEKQQVSVDSMYQTQWIFQNYLFGMFKFGRPKLTGETHTGDSLTQSYMLYDSASYHPMAECQLRYTSKIPQLDLSICKQLDSAKNMKLYYFAYVADSVFIRKNGILSGTFGSEYQLKKILVENKDEILKYFNSL